MAMQQRPMTAAALARGRREFVTEAVAKLGGDAPAAERLGVTRAVFWHWANVQLSVEGAVVLAEALELPYEEALRWATRRLPQPQPQSGAGPTPPHAPSRRIRRSQRAA